ncbi:MAG: hypothetical protein JHC55_01175 [Mycolicibacterium sp.]|nr:hypothetical protein [Mycolicibacterium sp.]
MAGLMSGIEHRCPACDVVVEASHSCVETWEEDGAHGYATTRCVVDERGVMSVSVSGGNGEGMEVWLR